MTHALSVPFVSLPVALRAVQLKHSLLHQQVALMQSQENVLCDLGLLLSGGTAKLVKVNLHPFVALLVDRVVLVAQLLAGHSIGQGFGLGSSTVLVSTADVKSIDVANAAVSGVITNTKNGREA